MRLCIPQGCANLTWNRDHYDGRGDNAMDVSSRYWIVVWEQDHVELKGITVAAPGTYPAEGVFRGRISPQGDGLTDAVDDWRVGPMNSGRMGFTLTWVNSSGYTPNTYFTQTASQRPQQSVDMQEAALKVIRETAADICTTVPTEGSDHDVDLTGSANAKLDGGIGKIVGLGIEGAARFQQSTYQGVLRTDLAKAIQSGNDCKLNVFNTLVAKMLPSSPSLR